jgi:small conductance mechanosensitive channel
MVTRLILTVVEVSKTMKPTMLCVLAVLFAGLWIAQGPAVALAQDEDSPDVEEVLGELSAEQVGERAANLLVRINDEVERAAKYRQKMAVSSAEDSIVLRNQIYVLQVSVGEHLHDLADALVQLETEGAQPELRSGVEETYLIVTPRIWEHIAGLRGEIDQFRALRLSTPPEERSALEDQIIKISGRLNGFYDIGRVHLEKMEALGLDTTEDRALFVESVLDRADELSGRLMLDAERIGDLEVRAKDTPDDASVAALRVATQKSMDNNAASLVVACDLMDAFELESAEYRAQLVTTTSDLSTGLTDTGVAVTLLSRAVDRFFAWISENGPTFVIKLLLFTLILIAFYFGTRLLRKALDKALKTSNLNISRLLRRMIVSSVSNFVMLFGLLVALSQLGISLGPLLAGLGVAGFIIGFALQDTLANFASGMMILLYRPYDVGDLVDVSGVFGKVNKMSLVSTTILTLDNQTLVVPNKKIWGDVIKNVTAQDLRRVDMTFGISYSDDIPKAERIFAEILQEHDQVLDEPAPMIHLHELGDSSVNFIVRPWVRVDDYWDVYWYVMREVKMRFDAEGVSIPFPQRDVHIYEERLISKADPGDTD